MSDDSLVGFVERVLLLRRREAVINAKIDGLHRDLRAEGIPARVVKELRRLCVVGDRLGWRRTLETAWDRLHAHEAQGTIYFLRCCTTGLIKIGFSERARARIAAIRRQSSTDIDLLLTVKGDLAAEGRLHARFAATRHHNEWFHPSPSLLAEIDRLRATGHVDAAPLLSWKGSP